MSQEQKSHAEQAYRDLAKGSYSSLLRELGDLKGKRILEVGCGPGQLIKAVSKFEPKSIVGLDIDDAWLTFCEERNESDDVMFIRSSAEDLPFEAYTFEVVICRSVLSYVPGESRAIEEMARVLTVGGVVSLELSGVGYYIYRLFKMKSIGLQYSVISLLSGLIHQVLGRKTMIQPDTYQTPGRIREVLSREGFQLLSLVKFDRWSLFKKFFRVTARKEA